jgi:hypothetical protein
MKLAAIGFIVSVFLGSPAIASDDLSERPLFLDRTFLPDSFEEGDDVQVIVSGLLKDTCQTAKQAQIERIDSQFFVNIQSESLGCFCLPMETPFFKVIKLGKLPVGDYWVQVNDLSLVRHIQVERSPASTLDLAYVTSVKLNGNELVIKGKHFDSGVYIESVDVTVQLDGTIVVNPILGERKGLKMPVTVAFEERVDLNKYLVPNFNHLVHVRGQKGKTFNVMFGVFSDPKIKTVKKTTAE